MGLTAKQIEENKRLLAEAAANAQFQPPTDQEPEETPPEWVIKAMESGTPMEKQEAMDFMRTWKPRSGTEKPIGEILAKSLRKGWAGTRVSFGETRELISEDEERAEKIAENKKIAGEEIYTPEFGEGGLEQFRNMRDPRWWASAIGEAIPGSAPFIAGAIGGGAAGMYFGPYTAIIGAAMGGGIAVFAQEFGGAYNEYLEAHPGDSEGAEDYALKKSGLSSVISAATVPLALAGRSIEPFKRYLIQGMLQSAMETGDTVSGNLLTRRYVDPNLDPFTGVARGIVSEFAFESPALVSSVAGRQARAEQRQKESAVTKQAEENMESAMENAAQEETVNFVAQVNAVVEGTPLPKEEILEAIRKGDFSALNTDQLKQLADKLKVRYLPIDNSEALFNKIKEHLKAESWKKVEVTEAERDMKSEVTFEGVFKEQKEIFDGFSGQQIFDYVQQEFDMGNPEQTWDLFVEWGRKQGDFSFEAPAFESEFYKDGAFDNQIREALAHASANLLHNEQTSGPINYSLGGRGQFRDYIRQFTDKYSRETLENQYKTLYDPENILSIADKEIKHMSNTDLASKIAEKMMILENARMKKEKSISPVEINVVEKLRNTETTGLESNPRTTHEVSPQGNAYSARAVVYGENGQEQGTIFFERELLEDKEFNNLLDRAGVERDFTPEELARIGKQGRLVAYNVRGADYVQHEWQKNVKGKTIEELVIDPVSAIPGAQITQLGLMGTTLPQYQRDLFTKKKGQVSALLRPAGRLGAVTFHKKKQFENVLRVFDRMAKSLASDLEVSIIKAAETSVPKKFGVLRTKKYLEAEKKIREQVRSFLRKTKVYPDELSKEQKTAMQKEINRLEANKVGGVITTPEELRRHDEKIQYLIDTSEGHLPIKVAIQELPENVQKPARKARESIDALTKRILNEFPPETLGDKDGEKGYTREILEKQLGEYAVTSFAMFEPGLGWNPRFSKKWLKSKVAQDAYKGAVVAVKEMNRGDSNWDGEKGTQKAMNVVDDVISQVYYQSATDTQRLPGVLKVTEPAAGTSNLPAFTQMLQERYKIPFALRKLMGEVTDPTLMVAASVSRLSRLVEQQNFYRDLLRDNDMPGEMMFSQNKVEGVFTEQIDPLDEFNPLRGLWTTKDWAREISVQRISDANDWSPMIQLWKAFAQIKGGTQGLMIIASPGTQSRNVTGAAAMFGAAGHLIQGNWADTFSVIREDLFPGLSYDKDGKIIGNQAKARELVRTAAQLGVTHSSARLGDAFGIAKEMESGKYTTLDSIGHAFQTIRKFDAENPRTAVATGLGAAVDKTVGAGWRLMKGTYVAVDDYFKMMAWGANMIEMKNMLSRYDELARTTGATGSDVVHNQDGTVVGLTDEWKLALLRDYSSTLTTNIGTYRSNAAVLYRNVTDLDTYVQHLAAHLTRNTMPNYDYVGPFARFWRKIPFGNFIAFDTEMVRTTGNLIQLQYKDAAYRIPEDLMQRAGLPKEKTVWNAEKNAEGQWVSTKPYIKEIRRRPFYKKAMKRAIIGNAFIIGLIPAAVKLGQVMFDIEDEDLEAADKIGPDYAKGSSRAPASPLAKDGSGFKSFVLDYLLPHAFLHRVNNIITQSIKESDDMNENIPEAAMKGAWEAFFQFMETYFAVSIAPATAFELLNNRNKRGKEIYNESDDLGEKWKVGMRYVLDEAGPGGYRQMRDVYKAFSEEEDLNYTEWGKKIEEVDALLKVGGISAVETNPNESLGYYMKSVQARFKSEVTQNLDNIRYSTQTSPQEFVEQWEDLQKRWFELQKEMYFMLQFYERLNIDPKIYKEQLKERLGNLPGVYVKTTKPYYYPNIIKNLEEGVFTPWVIQPKYKTSFEEVAKKIGSKKVWPKKELKDKYKILRKAEVSLLAHPTLPLPWEEG